MSIDITGYILALSLASCVALPLLSLFVLAQGEKFLITKLLRGTKMAQENEEGRLRKKASVANIAMVVHLSLMFATALRALYLLVYVDHSPHVDTLCAVFLVQLLIAVVLTRIALRRQELFGFIV